MTPTAKKMALLQKKLDHVDNDLFKLMARDLIVQNFFTFEPKNLNIVVDNSLKKLRDHYVKQIVELRNIQKGKTKQIDLEDAIKEAKTSQLLDGDDIVRDFNPLNV